MSVFLSMLLVLGACSVGLVVFAKDYDFPENDWAYMYAEDPDQPGDVDRLLNENLPGHSKENGNAIPYLDYGTAWNPETANYVAENVTQILEGILGPTKNGQQTLGQYLTGVIDGIFTDATLDTIIETVVGLIDGLTSDVMGTPLNEVLCPAGGLATLQSYCDKQDNGDGTFTYTSKITDWGVDALGDDIVAKRDQFTTQLAKYLAPPFKTVIDMLFLKVNYPNALGFLNIGGSDGWDYAIIPLLEALGVRDIKTLVAFGDGGNPGAVLGHAANTHTDEALKYLLDVLLARIYEIIGTEENDLVNNLVDVILNLVYTLNADGVKSICTSLLMPLSQILGIAGDLLGDNIKPILELLQDFSTEHLLAFLESNVGVHLPENCQKFLCEFYFGQVVPYTSSNGRQAFQMVFSDTETKKDFVTIIVSLFLEILKDPANEALFSSGDLLAIKQWFSVSGPKEMNDYEWLYADKADTDKVFSGIEASKTYVGTYGQYWTKEKAQYTLDNIPALVGNVLDLLGIEIGGTKINSLPQLVQQLLTTELYTQKMADTIINLLKSAVSSILGLESWIPHVANVANEMDGLNFHVWDNMTVEVVDGNRESFENALAKILAAGSPVWKILFGGKSVPVLTDYDGKVQMYIPGSDGYAYGVVPLLEALGVEGLPDTATYDEKVASPDPAVNEEIAKAVLHPVFDLLDKFAKDPVNELMDLIPSLVYFIESGAVVPAFRNIVNSIDTLITALSPAGVVEGRTSLEEYLVMWANIDIHSLNTTGIFNLLINALKGSYNLTPVKADLGTEFLNGKIVSYTSANGETYKKMVLGEDQRADMLTILLRVVLGYITEPTNLATVKTALGNAVGNSAISSTINVILDTLGDSAKKDPSMGQAINSVYEIFLVLNESMNGFTGIYDQAKQSWLDMLKPMLESPDPQVRELGNMLAKNFDKYFGENIKSAGILSRSFMKLIKSLIEFISKMQKLFSRLFR